MMLTLNRGGPVVWISEDDAREGSLVDNDWVEVYNSNGAIVARVVVSQRMKPGTIYMYHAQEKILALLDTVHANTESYLRSLSEKDLSTEIDTPWGESIPLKWIIWHVIEHEIHHRGELSLILGILGKEGLDV